MCLDTGILLPDTDYRIETLFQVKTDLPMVTFTNKKTKLTITVGPFC